MDDALAIGMAVKKVLIQCSLVLDDGGGRWRWWWGCRRERDRDWKGI